jgi:toxin FitB
MCRPVTSGIVAELLLDTDVLIDHLRGHRALVLGTNGASYSVITRCELYSGRHVQEGRVDTLLAPFRELSVDRAVAERAGRLRRDGSLRTPDALIAATALEHDLILVTRNVGDFGSVRSLRIHQPGDAAPTDA